MRLVGAPCGDERVRKEENREKEKQRSDEEMLAHGRVSSGSAITASGLRQRTFERARVNVIAGKPW